MNYALTCNDLLCFSISLGHCLGLMKFDTVFPMITALPHGGILQSPARSIPASQRPSDSGIVVVAADSEGRDTISATLADRMLSTQPSLSRSASALAPSQEALAMLARWLPQGPVSGGRPVAAIAEEEVRPRPRPDLIAYDVEI